MINELTMLYIAEFYSYIALCGAGYEYKKTADI